MKHRFIIKYNGMHLDVKGFVNPQTGVLYWRDEGPGRDGSGGLALKGHYMECIPQRRARPS